MRNAKKEEYIQVKCQPNTSIIIVYQSFRVIIRIATILEVIINNY